MKIIYEDCCCSDSGGGSGGAPVIQMNAVGANSGTSGKIKHIITPSIKSKIVTEAINYINENILLDKLVLPDLDSQFKQKEPISKELSQYSSIKTKEHITNEFKNNPELAKKVIKKVNKIEEVSVLTLIKNQLTNSNSKAPVDNLTKTGNLISTHGQLSKSGEANSMMGSKQVIKNTLNVANGVNSGIKTESTVIEERSMSYRELVPKATKPVITPKKNQTIETHYDKAINSPTRHLKSGQKILVAQQLSKVKGNLQADRDALKKISSMQQSV